jgi:hypothetical protein
MARMKSLAPDPSSCKGDLAAGRPSNSRSSRLSSDGAFANGVTAAAVTQFIFDYDETARIEDVAAYFDLDVTDIAVALQYYALHGERMRASGQVVPR